MVRSIFVALAVVGLLTSADLCGAESENIAHLYKGGEVKVFIKSVINDSGNNKVSVDNFKKELEKAFQTRKSYPFKIVSIAQDSDIQVDAVITKCQYLLHGPIKPSVSIVTTAIDAAASAMENYIDMDVHFVVMGTKKGKLLWEGDSYDFIKQVMTEEEGIPLIYDKVARKFVAKTFGKPSSEKKILF